MIKEDEVLKLAELADEIDEADYIKVVRIVSDMDSTTEQERLILADDCAVIVAALRRSPSPTATLPSRETLKLIEAEIADATKKHIIKLHPSDQSIIARAVVSVLSLASAPPTEGLIGGTNFCGHAMMAAICPTCAAEARTGEKDT